LMVMVLAGGFLLISLCVIALGRGATARWERERRAARAQRQSIGPSTPLTRAPSGLRRGLAKSAAAARFAAVSPRVPLKAAGRMFATPRRQLMRREKRVPADVGRPLGRFSRSPDPGPEIGQAASRSPVAGRWRRKGRRG
jgi:hypothetical protein